MDAFARVGIGIDIVSVDHEILFQNQVLKEKFGNCAGETCYKRYMNLERPCEFCPMEKAIKNNNVERTVLKGIDKNDYELISVPLPNSNGTIDNVVEITIDITKQKAIEEELRFKDHIINSTSNAIATSSLEGIISHVNPAFVKMWGYTESKEICGKNFKELFDTNPFLSEIIQILLKERSWFGELKAKRKDGSLFDIQASANIIFNDKGTPIGLMASINDITELKLRDQKLKQSEDLFYTTFQLNHNIMSITTIEDGTFIEVNKTFLDVLGYEREEVIGRTTKELGLISFQARPKIIKELEERHYVKNIELEIKKSDGTLLQGLISISMIFFRDKPYWLSTINDITDLKKAETKLKESEELFKILAEQSLMGIVIIQDNQVQYINQACLNIYGVSLEQVRIFGLNELLRRIHPDDKEFVYDQMRKKISLEPDPDVIANYQLRALNQSGKIVWTEVYSKSITFNGKPAIFITLIDINEKKKAEENL